jgi:hypothetical protein
MMRLVDFCWGVEFICTDDFFFVYHYLQFHPGHVAILKAVKEVRSFMFILCFACLLCSIFSL